MEKHLTLALAAAAALTFGASGCRIGNHETDAPVGDGFSGYYATSAQSLDFYATHGATTGNASAPPNLTPDRLASIVTDPVTLALEDATSGSAVLYTPNGATDYLPITIDPTTKNFGVSGSYPQSILWDDSACLFQEFVEIDGQIDPLGTTPSLMNFQGAAYTITGNLTMTVRIEDKITGTCTASLAAMSQCYQDATQCGASTAAANQANQDSVQSFFLPYIQAGAMVDSDIPTTSSLAYQVTYQ